MGFLCKQGWFKLWLFASLYFGSGWTEFCWAFSCYLVFLFLYLPAGRQVGLQFRAGQTIIPRIHKALSLVASLNKLISLELLNNTIFRNHLLSKIFYEKNNLSYSIDWCFFLQRLCPNRFHHFLYQKNIHDPDEGRYKAFYCSTCSCTVC